MLLFYSKKTNSLLLSLSLSLSCSSDITDLHCSKNHVLYMVLFKFVFKKEWCLSRGGGGRRGRKKKNEVSKKKRKKTRHKSSLPFFSFLFFSILSFARSPLLFFGKRAHAGGAGDWRNYFVDCGEEIWGEKRGGGTKKKERNKLLFFFKGVRGGNDGKKK